ncbi:Recombination endonuclease VII [uncultured Caudovirales phage]|uniref:Recombination endonuclease VII n=1 Tax=uncultured Caudovirales phage TaxID=2100421 RepID=A0A6J5SP28_9CAUD|nr:Recombination endonuclease VII [uncultured Caudovirales phage]
MCIVIGCENEIVAKGMCDMHYRRFKRHGNLEQTRPADWGSREKHPLYSSWAWLRRSKKDYLCIEWQKDFWKFVQDVGDRPENSKLVRIDLEKDLSPTNFMWKENLLTTKGDGGRNAYQRAHRLVNPDCYKNIELKKSFGITLEEYRKKQEEQSNVCAICGNPEVDVDKKAGRVRGLAVDHNHTTGQVRGLLCRGCNQGIGNFQEDLQRLKNAVSYLERHENGIQTPRS